MAITEKEFERLNGIKESDYMSDTEALRHYVTIAVRQGWDIGRTVRAITGFAGCYKGGECARCRLPKCQYL